MPAAFPSAKNAGMNPLATYLQRTELGQSQFAKQFGFSATQVSLWLHGKRRPSLDEAFRLEAATGGAIPAKAWLKKRIRKLAA